MKRLRADFPILDQSINGFPYTYLDNAATSQKPRQVVDALADFYLTKNANIHRGAYFAAEFSTDLYEKARSNIALFIGAQADELVFTSGSTEGINFIASTWAMDHVKDGDEIVISALEHHANIIPWQQVVQKKNAVLKVIPVNDQGVLVLDNLDSLINVRTRLVALTHTSNALGTCVDTVPIVTRAKSVGARVLIDAAQSVGHQKIDVKVIGADFLVFSGHKILGPTGIGGLYIKKELQDTISPYKFGGGMVYEVDFTSARYLSNVHKFEAGTPPIAQAIGLSAAISYLRTIDMSALQRHEAALCALALDGLSTMKGVSLLGPLDQIKQKGHLFSFMINKIHAHDVAGYLSDQGICVRAGHHCAQPLFKMMGIQACVRVSCYLYNSTQDIDRLLIAVDKLIHTFCE